MTDLKIGEEVVLTAEARLCLSKTTIDELGDGPLVVRCINQQPGGTTLLLKDLDRCFAADLFEPFKH